LIALWPPVVIAGAALRESGCCQCRSRLSWTCPELGYQQAGRGADKCGSLHL